MACPPITQHNTNEHEYGSYSSSPLIIPSQFLHFLWSVWSRFSHAVFYAPLHNSTLVSIHLNPILTARAGVKGAPHRFYPNAYLCMITDTICCVSVSRSRGIIIKDATTTTKIRVSLRPAQNIAAVPRKR